MQQQQPVEELAEMSVHPPSPSKIKTGPWLSGTYKLPKSVSCRTCCLQAELWACAQTSAQSR